MKFPKSRIETATEIFKFKESVVKYIEIRWRDQKTTLIENKDTSKINRKIKTVVGSNCKLKQVKH